MSGNHQRPGPEAASSPQWSQSEGYVFPSGLPARRDASSNQYVPLQPQSQPRDPRIPPQLPAPSLSTAGRQQQYPAHAGEYTYSQPPNAASSGLGASSLGAVQYSTFPNPPLQNRVYNVQNPQLSGGGIGNVGPPRVQWSSSMPLRSGANFLQAGIQRGSLGYGQPESTSRLQASQERPSTLETPSNLNVNAPSPRPIYRVIEGADTGIDNEKLDPKFKLRPKDFFKKFRVFMMLWSQPADLMSNTGKVIGIARDPTYGEYIYTKIRRFIVVREGDEYCTCIPIVTYQGHGLSRVKKVKSEHAIAHTEKTSPVPTIGEKPQPGEAPMRRSIRIQADELGDKLDEMSRIDYGRMYTVEKNIKARAFGWVHEVSRHRLDYDFLNVFMGEEGYQIWKHQAEAAAKREPAVGSNVREEDDGNEDDDEDEGDDVDDEDDDESEDNEERLQTGANSSKQSRGRATSKKNSGRGSRRNDRLDPPPPPPSSSTNRGKAPAERSQAVEHQRKHGRSSR